MIKRLAFLIGLSLLSALAAAQAANTATISFVRPTTFADGSALPSSVAVTYNVYQGDKGATKAKVATVGASPASVTTGLLAGKEYCWQLTAVANAVEGVLSNEACKTFPFVAPGPFVITVQ